MNNNIDVLRALCFTKEDMKSITNLGDSFSEIEIEFMEEFKKIYELGLVQLEKFIKKLDEEGKELEPWDIEYYLTHLFNGPLGSYARELGKDKKYFPNLPDIMGLMGNNQTSRHNVTLFEDDIYPLETNVDVYNKTPLFVQNLIVNSTKTVEKFFRESVKSSTVHDNTLPLIDKAPQQRYILEPTGEWVLKSNASYMVKDSFYRIQMEDVRQKIFDKVKEIIQEENFRIFEHRKQYSPFDSEKNQSTSRIYEIEKKVKDGDKEKELELDIMGDVFDDRETKLKVETPDKNKEYLLNTVKGQMGI